MDNAKIHALQSRLAKCKLSEREGILQEIATEEANAKPVPASSTASVPPVMAAPLPVATNQDQTFEIIRKQLALAVRDNREQGILDFGKLLVDSTLQDQQTQRDAGKITDRSAGESALTVFQDVYVSVVVQNCR